MEYINTGERYQEIIDEFEPLINDFCEKYEALKIKHGLKDGSGIFVPFKYKERGLRALHMTINLSDIQDNSQEGNT